MLKNREKYRNELMSVIKVDGRICGFVMTHGVFQMLGKDKESFCGETSCVDCAVALQLWLDEEYEESKVDWDNVPVDTLVQVRDDENDEWTLMYLKGVDKKDPKYRYMAWTNGATSKTACGYYEKWRYCELVEEEDDEEFR